MTLTRFAPAKINLCLHVGRPIADGRHPLESLVAFARDVGDSLSASPADALSLQITGPFADALSVSEDNLVLRAARVLGEAANVTPQASLLLEKHLPIASGIGGGSADAAATLHVLNDLWGLGLSLEELEIIAAGLGADVPACVRSQSLRMTGTGETIERAVCPPLHAVLVNPRTPAPTGAVFRAFDAAGHGAELLAPVAPPHAASEMFRWLSAQTNDLEPAACAVAPVIAEVLTALRRQAPQALVRMSGSGATCFALTADADKSAHLVAAMQAAHPAWWTRATVLG